MTDDKNFIFISMNIYTDNHPLGLVPNEIGHILSTATWLNEHNEWAHLKMHFPRWTFKINTFILAYPQYLDYSPVVIAIYIYNINISSSKYKKLRQKSVSTSFHNAQLFDILSVNRLFLCGVG